MTAPLPAWAADDLTLEELRALIDIWGEQYGGRDVTEDELRGLVADATEGRVMP